MSILESCSSSPGGGGGGRGLPAVARPKELLLTGRVWKGAGGRLRGPGELDLWNVGGGRSGGAGTSPAGPNGP